MKAIKYCIIATALATFLGSVVNMCGGSGQSRLANASRVFTPEQVEQAISDLCFAIRMGNVDSINQALIDGADANQADGLGRTPLVVACWAAEPAIVELLLNHRADANQANGVGRTPLVYACGHGDIPIVELLINHSANVNQRDNCGDTPLLKACLNGNSAIVKLLLNHGANANQSDNYFDTPLLAACRNGHVRILKRLASHGATLFHDDSQKISEAQRLIIEQALEAGRQVGNYCLSLDDVDRLSFRTPTPLPVNLVADVYRFTHPLVGVQDPDLRELIKEQIIKNRERLLAQERATEQKKRAHAESDYKPVGFYMMHLLSRQHQQYLSGAQQADLIARLNVSSNDNGELTTELANAIIANYLEALADNVEQEEEEERKDNEDAQALAK